MRKLGIVVLCCGLRVYTQQYSPAKAAHNSPAIRSQNVRLRITTYICTQSMRSLSASLSTYKNLVSTLFPAHLSPLSTSPINTTTRYIK